jgi:hypothetical protein
LADADESPYRRLENCVNYYSLKSILSSRKEFIDVKSASDSFFLTPKRVSPYIEPTFTKEEYPTEQPAILLVFAVGASGKTTTAHALAHDTRLPILDLAKHKPVGDNTLTGILTTVYPIEKVGAVLEGLRKGTHGIIIDGIDEGRSKTTEQGFEAFLDDLIERSKGADATSIVVFGRSQVLLSTWIYLADKGADVGLVKIDPFNLEQAKGYIDAYVPQRNRSQQDTYENARDAVLSELGSAFATSRTGDDAFLAFIGYPPVLDAVATLLRTESNYHRVSQALGDGSDGDLEVQLLIRIADFLLRRERKEKALPNFIDAIASKADAQLAQELRDTLYSPEEQCARVLARALGRPFPRRIVSDNALNEEYEKALTTWCPEHPFLDDDRVRNAVFEAISVARCTLSTVAEYQTLAYDYTRSKQPTYHLLYIMSGLATTAVISVRFFNMLIQSCSEFLGTHGEIEVEVSGVSWDEPDVSPQTSAEIELTVSFADAKQERTFKFNGTVSTKDVVPLGPYLVNTTVTLPCDIDLQGTPALECTGTCRVVAHKVHVDTPDLIVRRIVPEGKVGATEESGLFLDVNQATGNANMVSIKAGTIEIGCVSQELAYPLAKYVRKTEKALSDPGIAEKYLRLRRILLEFRSHSKGALAKYRDKIEHERVLRNEHGRRVLALLLKEGVLRSDRNFYFVQPEQFSSTLGITWQQLRQHKTSHRLLEFLKRV